MSLEKIHTVTNTLPRQEAFADDFSELNLQQEDILGNNDFSNGPGWYSCVDWLKTRPSIGPAIVYGHSLTRAVSEDFKESDNKLVKAGMVGAIIASQAIDRARLTIIAGPAVAVDVLEKTKDARLCGLALAGVFMVVNGTAGEILNQGMHRFPSTTSTFNENHPDTIRVFKDALHIKQDENAVDVLVHEKKQEEEASKGRLSQVGSYIGRIIRRTPRHLSQGFVGLGTGSGAFVATSTVDGATIREASVLNHKVNASTGALVFLMGYGVGETYMKLIENEQYEAAQNLYEWVNTTWHWYAIAGGFVLWGVLDGTYRKWKLGRQDIKGLPLLEEESQTHNETTLSKEIK